jgi:putative membrane protein
MHAKIVLVLAALAYHYSCGVLLRKFEQGANRRSHVFYRWFNEVPVLILTAATAFVVIKPF